MKKTGLTVEDLNTIGEHWNTDEKKYCKKLQRIYNKTLALGEEKDRDCLCTFTRRRVWIAWFRTWALENNFYEHE